MSPWIPEAGAVVAALAGWFGLYGLMLAVTRPRALPAAPATQDLGPEPPAVASLLASGWEVTDDAAESTLLDLGARGYVEFRQPADDPHHTTIHLRDKAADQLRAYERRVLERVRSVAVGGVVPLTALTFRDHGRAHAWWKALRAEVIADARRLGLSRRRFPPPVLTVLTVAAALVGAVVAGVSLRYLARTGELEDDLVAGIFAGVIAFFALAGFAGRDIGETDTPAGREVAARWLGVRSWLRAHEAFGDLPPSAVAVWDRYLPYGAAVGTTRVASAVIELGMGNRRLVWSSFGGTWHRVKVSYPRLWPRYGRPPGVLVLRALLALGAGYLLARYWDDVGPVRTVGLLVGLGLLGYGLYALARVVIDAAAPRTVTGQVLWKQLWRTRKNGDDSTAPWLHYLAIDDGRGDQTQAWILPNELESTCDTGDVVTMSVRRWPRRVIALAAAEQVTPQSTAHQIPPR